jgi:hypothetical protein
VKNTVTKFAVIFDLCKSRAKESAFLLKKTKKRWFGCLFKKKAAAFGDMPAAFYLAANTNFDGEKDTHWPVVHFEFSQGRGFYAFCTQGWL